MTDKKHGPTHDESPELEPQLREVATLVAEALRAEVPPHVARRHEVLLLSLAGGNDAPRAAQAEAAADVVALPVGRRRRMRTVGVLAAAMVLVLGSSAIAFADGAQPGDRLYGIDRALERIELARTRHPESRADVRLSHAAERLEEVRAMLAAGRDGEVPNLIQDAEDDFSDALEDADSADEPETIRAHVLAQRERHIQQLMTVRDKLAAGPANQRAVQALDRVIARAQARMAGQGGQPDSDDAPGRSGGHRKDQSDRGQGGSGSSGKPPDAGQSEREPKPRSPARPASPGQQAQDTGSGGRPDGAGGGPPADAGGGPPSR